MDAQQYKKRMDTYEIIVITLIILVVAAGIYSYSHFRVTESKSSAYEPQNSDAAQDVRPVAQSLTPTPTPAVPRMNPFSETNPFASTYENPFQ